MSESLRRTRVFVVIVLYAFLLIFFYYLTCFQTSLYICTDQSILDKNYKNKTHVVKNSLISLLK